MSRYFLNFKEENINNFILPDPEETRKKSGALPPGSAPPPFEKPYFTTMFTIRPFT